MRPDAPAEAALLPESMAALASVIGWPATLAMVEAFAGRSLDIAVSETEMMHGIAAVIGDTAAAKLAAAYAPAVLYVPACAELARAERNRRMRDEVRSLEQKMTTRRAVTRTAQLWRFTERTVWRCLAPSSTATETAPLVTLRQLPLL